jgi:hypothetical protein
MVRSDQPTGLIARRLERLHKVLHSAAAAGGCDLETREVLSADTDCWWQLP